MDRTEGFEGETPLEEATAGAVVGVTLLAGFGLLFAGVESFWVAFVVGFAGLLPAAMGAVRYYQQDATAGGRPKSETDEALEELRQRYARGELTEAEFERRVERLLETESVADARARPERTTTHGETGRVRDFDPDFDPDLDPERDR
jgi:uncharacterized membrane protein